jgi:hypothetical protein
VQERATAPAASRYGFFVVRVDVDVVLVCPGADVLRPRTVVDGVGLVCPGDVALRPRTTLEDGRVFV